MNICVFEDDQVNHLAPLTATRPVYDLRIGARTISEQSVAAFVAAGVTPRSVVKHARSALAGSLALRSEALVNRIPGAIGVLFVNGRAVLQTGSEAVAAMVDVARAEAADTDFVQDGELVAAWRGNAGSISLTPQALAREHLGSATREIAVSDVSMVSRLWHLLDFIASNIEEAFQAAAHGYNVLERPGAVIHQSAILERGEHIFVDKDATVAAGAILDASDGPIVISSGATVSERSVVKGPVYIGPGSAVKIGANVRKCALGPRCKVGGEVHDVVMHSYSNKAHDGFLGDAYVASWCNLGAATNNSNLKNDYGSVRLYNEALGAEEDSGRLFAGLFMADHAKCSIGTTFNTGSIVGVACNLFGAGFHPRQIPSFCWGSPGRYATYRFEKAIHVAERVMQRRDLTIDPSEVELLRDVFDQSESARSHFLGR